MSWTRLLCLTALAASLSAAPSRADEPKKKPDPVADKVEAKDKDKALAQVNASAGKVSFLKDVAPILVQNCIACHNPKKSESKYTMTSFALLAKGGQQGEGITLEAGDPDASRFVELLKPDGEPRMPYKQDPLPPEKVALIERWVKEGARYDGGNPAEDWTTVLRKMTPIVIPENYSVTVPITALTFSPDGSRVAAGGYHEVTLWKVADGALAGRIKGLAERVYEVAYSPDGKWMAVASGDPGQFGSVKLFSATPDGDAKPAKDLNETSDSVLAVAFSPDSKLVAAGGADRSVRVWEVESGKQVALIEDHADWVTDLAFSPDGKKIATASRDKTCKVFDVEKKESLVTFPGHAQTVNAVAFTPDGKSVVSGGEDNQLRFWNPTDDGKQTKQVGGFGGAVFRILFAPDGKSLVASSGDKMVRAYTANGSSERPFKGHNDWVYSVAISPDGKTVASGSWDGEIRLWNFADAKPVRTIIAAPGFKAAAK